jgi:outer membrane protein TolC
MKRIRAMKTRMKLAAIVLMLLVTGNIMAQEKLITLDQALKSAEKNYPLVKQKQLIQESGKTKEKLWNASLYPQVNVAGQAVYQSEVTKLSGPDFPTGIGQKPDNYNIGLEMRLPLTEFGTVQTRKQLEQAQTSVGLNQVDQEFQKVRERVVGLVGNLMLQKENEIILKLRMQELDSQVRKVSVTVANGAVLKTNQLVLESESLSTSQRIDDIKGVLNGLTKELSILTGLKIDSNTKFQIEPADTNSQTVNRPELKVFEAQKNALDLQSELVKKESRPNLFLFGQGYNGRPGYNFLNTNMRFYGIAGVGLTWNLNSLLTRSKQEKVLDLNKGIIEKQAETFNVNLDAVLAEKTAEIEKYKNFISKDVQIVKLRQEVSRAASSQLANGVITSTEYLAELNGQTTAELNRSMHQVQLDVALAQYNILLGN